MNICGKDIIWSKGPIRDNYSKVGTEKNTEEELLIEKIKISSKIIWIRLGSYKTKRDLDIFSSNIDKLKNPVDLITTDGDRNVPSSYSEETINNILNSNKILSWRTQNYDRTIIHKKLKHYPIGFNLHTKKWLVNKSIEDKIKFMIENRKKPSKKIVNRIFCDSGMRARHRARKKMYNKIKDNELIDFTPNRLSFVDIYSKYTEYLFVISPRGNGLDCHRTWELFLAGCIVIMESSALDSMFINNNLPVIIIKNYEELNTNLTRKLKIWKEEIEPLTLIDNIMPKLKSMYWG